MRSASRIDSRPPCCFPHGGPRCRRRLARRRHRGGFAPTAMLPGTSTARLKRAPIEALLTSNSSLSSSSRRVRRVQLQQFSGLWGSVCSLSCTSCLEISAVKVDRSPHFRFFFGGALYLSTLGTGLLRMGPRQTPLTREMAACQHRGRALRYAGAQES